MIIAKPKMGTLFSLGVFITICLGTCGYLLFRYLNEGQFAMLQYVIMLVTGSLGLGLLARIILGYRIVSIGKSKIEVRYPTRFKTLNYKLQNILHCRERKVKTASGTFKELEVQFDDKKKLMLSYQEHTDYPKVISYLRQKCPKKFKAE